MLGGGGPVACPLCLSCDPAQGCVFAPRTPCKQPAVQLQGENGACFESDFSAGGIRVNDSQRFVGRSD